MDAQTVNAWRKDVAGIKERPRSQIRLLNDQILRPFKKILVPIMVVKELILNANVLAMS